MASLRFRAGCSGTHSQVSAIAINSALRVAFFLLGRHFPGQFGIAMSQADNGPHDDEAGFIEVELAGIGQAHVEGRLSLLDLLDHGGQPMVVNPGVVQVAAATRPVKETDDKAGIIARFRIETILLLEDLQRAGLQSTLFPVIERPLVYPLVLRVLALLNGIVVFHPIHVPFRIRVDAVDGAGHAAHEEVFVDVELLPLQQGGHELGSTHDILVALRLRVNLLHDPDPLKINLSRVLLSCSFSRSIRALSALTLAVEGFVVSLVVVILLVSFIAMFLAGLICRFNRSFRAGAHAPRGLRWQPPRRWSHVSAGPIRDPALWIRGKSGSPVLTWRGQWQPECGGIVRTARVPETRTRTPIPRRRGWLPRGRLPRKPELPNRRARPGSALEPTAALPEPDGVVQAPGRV